jgi:hypothetical protein
MNVKAYCLDLMGITRWQSRDKENIADYLLLHSDLLPSDPSMQAMLERLLEALRWPLMATKQISCSTEESLEKINEKIAAFQPKKVILFGLAFAPCFKVEPKEQLISLSLPNQIIRCALVSSAHCLLQDKGAKRRAWEQLQQLIAS